MDVWGIYVGDSSMSSYGSSMRSTYYRDYEQFPYGTLEQTSTVNHKDPYSKVQEKCKQVKLEKTAKKQCPFCKEHKKRPLVTYMRKRESRKHHESICEDEEHEAAEEGIVEEEEEVVAEEVSEEQEQMRAEHQHHHK